MDLAHGTKPGCVKDCDITFVDASVSAETAESPAIIRLGRLIALGSEMNWSNKGVNLTFPNGKKLRVPVRNYCPYANKEVLSGVQKILADLREKKKTTGKKNEHGSDAGGNKKNLLCA